MAALVHRMNGALNNASMAFDLALADSARTEEKTAHVLRTGIAAVARASRAAALLAHLVHGRGVPPDDGSLYRQDVQEILREQAGGAADAHADEPGAEAAGSAADAAEWLVAELARLKGATR